MAPRNPKAAAADPRTFVDTSFVQELEDVGLYQAALQAVGADPPVAPTFRYCASP